ncbi:hypothetical protein [Isoptericola dokdonensis]|uniref:Uncharacterized protein n=1 Tax=Isoptericola dokdonensis DS-3 TaxID=1300344 RepID=A0A161HQJ0_9MICO|nr:hypothetical protein [Isoptericola dokdonensis]ANC31462.1 hypothetical protein I598_1914 [Isoptericola dokdonensis DS-3]
MSRRAARAARNDALHQHALEQQEIASSLALHADELAAARVELVGLLHPEVRGPQDGGRASRGEDVPAPIALHVLDTTTQVDEGIHEQYWLAVSALRQQSPATPAWGAPREAAVLRRLKFLADHAQTLTEVDLEQAKAITIRLRNFTHRSRAAAGHVVAPYLRERPCERCGQRSVWVESQNLAQRCSNPACGRTSNGCSTRLLR